MVKLSIIIPAYNEGKRIENTLKTWLAYLKKNKWNFELIVVDDGSKDNTFIIVKKFKNVKLISYKPNHGKGHAVRTGVLASKGDYVLFCDADLSTPVEELGNLFPYLNNYEIVIASRALKESRVKTLFIRKFLGRIFNFIVGILMSFYIKDTQCGFKLFRKEAAKEIFNKQIINGWAFDVEILFLAKKLDYKTKEVPIKWQHFEHEGVTPARQTIKMFKEVLKIRLNSLLGKYN